MPQRSINPIPRRVKSLHPVSISILPPDKHIQRDDLLHHRQHGPEPDQLALTLDAHACALELQRHLPQGQIPEPPRRQARRNPRPAQVPEVEGFFRPGALAFPGSGSAAVISCAKAFVLLAMRSSISQRSTSP